jgi:hypothetical protein
MSRRRERSGRWCGWWWPYLWPLPALLPLWHATAPDAVTLWGDEGWRVPVGR